MNSNIIQSHQGNIDYLNYAIPAGDTIYIFGPPSIGKTTMAEESLQVYHDVISLYINCNSMSSCSKIYISILKLLSQKLYCEEWVNLNKLISVPEFTRTYYKLELESRKEGFSRIYVVLDNLEAFYKTPMMETITVLSKTRNLSLMFCSSDSCEIFLNAISSDIARDRIADSLNVIQLPVWTKSDIIDVICEQEPAKFKALYRKFVTNIVSILYSVTTKDYVEIRNWCQTNFGNFLEFYKAKMHEMAWEEKALDPEETFEDDYLEEYPTKQSGNNRSANIIASYLNSLEGLKPPDGNSDFIKLNRDRKLNWSSSILIMAAFIAANTRPSDDKRNFVSFQKRKISSKARSVKVFNRFSLERLLQIYKGLISVSAKSMVLADPSGVETPKLRRSDFRNSVLSDVGLLEDLRMIEIATGDGLNPDTTYRLSTIISYAFVNRLARQCGFELEHFYGIKQNS